MGTNDYYQYYKLYKNWDYASVDAPFNTRIISPYLVYLFGKLNISYDANIIFSKIGYDPKVYFHAVFINYISTVLTCFVIFKTIEKLLMNRIVALLGGIIYLLGFGTCFYNLTGLTDAFSSLLFALTFYFYFQKSPYIFIVLLLAVIQREYILLVLGLMSVIHILSEKENKKYHIRVLAVSVLCFGFYFILRKTLFMTPPSADHETFEGQVEVGSYFGRMFNYTIHDWPAFIRQTILSQNLVFIYLGLLLYKFSTKQKINKINLLLVVLLFFQENIINFLAYLGNNGGRCFYMIMPLIVYFTAIEARPLLENYFRMDGSLAGKPLTEKPGNV